MLTKRQIAETIILQKSGGRPSTENNIDERDVFSVVDMLIAQMIATDLEMQLRTKGNFSIDSSWTRTFPSVVIQYDKSLGTCYIDLPASRIAISNDGDIRQVCWSQSPDAPFPMMAEASQSAWSQLEAVAYSDGTYPFYPDGDKLRFVKMPKRYKGKKLLVRMVAGVDGYEPDDVLPIPEKFAQDLIERTAAFFQVQISTRSKVTNDSNVNTK